MYKPPSLIKREKKLKKHKNVCENHDYVEMSKNDNKTLKYNPGEKSINPFVIYADLGSLL